MYIRRALFIFKWVGGAPTVFDFYLRYATSIDNDPTSPWSAIVFTPVIVMVSATVVVSL